jgi:hypothetical protein
MRRVSLSTACTVRGGLFCKVKEKRSRDTRTVLHFLEVPTGRCAGEAKSFDDFFPQTTTRVGIRRQKVYYKRQEGGCLVIDKERARRKKLSAYCVP